MSDWAHDYFERGYAERWGLPPVSDRIRLEAQGLWDLLQLTPSSRVLDIGCGHGRHALALAERGPDVVGVDRARVLLMHNASALTLAFGPIGFEATCGGCHFDPGYSAPPS